MSPTQTMTLEKALPAIRKLKQRAVELEARLHEPIAIISMACRLPGGIDGPEALWDALVNERDLVGSFPGRWAGLDLFDSDPEAVGKSYAREGGFIDDIESFDANFFGISPREAQSMDPQQRLLLQTSWEALERAGIVPGTLIESTTGVYIGAMDSDYAVDRRYDLDTLDGYQGTGSAGSVLSGRISYALGLQGPSMTIDTACSSSLVAVHLASVALRQRECELAVVGGVTVMSTPTMFVEFSRLKGLAPDGRCKSFSSRADGAGWSEGCAVLVLKRLSVAQREGDRILGFLRGSSVNQDGRSHGMTAPNGPSQVRVIRAALAAARLEPDAVDAVEAHGTGTSLGDPIEAGALARVYGRGRGPDQPLHLGSSKSNFGHCQAAAGIVGLMKMVLSLEHQQLPRTLHCDEPSPHIEWEGSGLHLLQHACPWPRSERPRRAGISSFGISGTNAHVILEEAPATETKEALPEPADGPVSLLLTGLDEAAVLRQAERLRVWLPDRPASALPDVAHTLRRHRTHHAARAVITVRGPDEALGALEALGAGREHEWVVQRRAQRRDRIAFVFPGQGGQWPGMGAALLDDARSSVFRETVEACDDALRPLVGWSVLERLRDPQAELRSSDVVQPALFSIYLGLAAVWRSLGIEPSAVVGHSQGEVPAAVVAGVLTLADGARVVAARSRAVAQSSARGGMALIGRPSEEVESLLAPYGDALSIAVVNTPSSTVVSGDASALDALLAALETQELFCRRVEVDYASHCAHMEPLLPGLRAELRSIEPRQATLPFYSTVTGGVMDGPELDENYWCRNLRQPVRFDRALARLLEDGHDAFVECSPHPLLTAPILDAEEVAVVGTLRREHGGRQQLLHGLGDLEAQGVPVPTEALLPGEGRFLADAPTYAFEPAPYWLSPPEERTDAQSMGLWSSEHAWLAVGTDLATDGGMMLSGRISPERDGWVAEHRVFETALVPGTGMLDLALAAARAGGSVGLEELTIAEPMPLGDEPRMLQISVSSPDPEGRRELSIYSRPSGGEEWRCHARGRTRPDEAAVSPPRGAHGVWPPSNTQELALESLYPRLATQGLDYGPSFRGLVEVWSPTTGTTTDVLYARVVLPSAVAGDVDRYGLHPALLDASLHALFLGAADRLEADEVLLPFSWSNVALYATGSTEVRVELRWQSLEAERAAVSLRVVDPAGQPVLEVGRLELRRANARTLRESLFSSGAHLFEVQLHPLPTLEDDDASSLKHTVVLGEANGLAARLQLDAVDDFEPLLERVRSGGERLSRVIVDTTVFAGPESTPLGVAERAMDWQQRWLSEPAFDDTELLWVTHEAIAAGERVEDLTASPLWGLVRVARTEHPERKIRLLDVDEASTGAALTAAIASRAAAVEPELVVRSGRRTMLRLARANLSRDERARPLAPEGTVLMTGGTGELGRAVARHLVEHHGARHLLLLSRRGERAPGADDVVAQLEAAGARTVTVRACDVAERSEVAAAIASIPSEHPLTAVFHLAGVLDDGMLAGQTPERLRRVLAPKVLGGLHLHELTASEDLAAFVLFSSLAGTVGAAGQSTYASANTFVDALAAWRRARGLPGLSLAWGLWAQQGVGMTAGLGRVELARMRQQGIAPLSAEEGLTALDAALRGSAAYLVPAKLELGSLQARQDRGDEVPPLFGGLLRAKLRRAQTDGDGTSLRLRLAGLSGLAQKRLVVELVREQAAAVLSLSDASAVGPAQVLKGLGLDSLMAVELRNRLAQLVQSKLPATLAFDYPTPEDIARLLLEKLTDGALLGARPRPEARRSPARDDDPIVIVSMACRVPGGIDTPEAFWRALDAEADLVSEFPERWRELELYDPDPEASGKSYTREGGFIHDVEDFDPEFFGISPREAESMDPQQRITLEVAWEALERAGLSPAAASEVCTGVYLGTMGSDYGLARRQDLTTLDGYQSTGNASSVLSGRVSYAFGLQGPAITVDTACSSSLVSLHLASAALRSGECDVALAGGVTVMSSPAIFVEFSRLRGMAPDGRCKSFSAAADGAGWSEGCGIVVLKRQSDALRDNDRVLAVIRSSAVNQDGRSQGLTAPNGPSQQRVIHEALRRAGLTPADIDAVEAHGTGTSLGDPIEAGALQEVFGPGRPAERPLWLGSSKSNLGHCQAAAGIVGVLKMVLALQHDRLPRTLHVEQPTDAIEWEDSGLALLREARSWPRGEQPRRAGISSFGISGTNIHLILEDAAPSAAAAEEPAHVASSAWVPLPLSAGTPDALGVMAGRWADWLEAQPATVALPEVAAAASRRASLTHRAAVVAREPHEAVEALRALSEGRPHGGVVCGPKSKGELAILFSGQGSQHLGMGMALCDALDGFRSRFDEVCEALDPELERSLRSVIGAQPEMPAASLLERTEYTQPALFALEVALYRQWEAWGVRPRFVVGHSVGEIAAAHVAGVLGLEDAARLVCARGRLMQACDPAGTMASLEAAEAEVLEAFGELDADARIAIAGLNTPSQTVVSGDVEAVRVVVERFAGQGRRTRRLRVSHAFHSPHMEAMQDRFRTIAQRCTYRPAQLEVVSTVSGLVDGELSTAEYWVEQVRRPVRFIDAMQTLHSAGVGTFLECGPHGVLCAMGAACVPSGRFVSSLRKDADEARALVSAAGALHVAGEALELPTLLGTARSRDVVLPTYPFQRQRYWQASPPRGDVEALGLGPGEHPWLRAATELADGTGLVMSGRLSPSSLAWVADHMVHGTVLMPGTGLLELALAAAARVETRSICELTMAEPMVFEEPRMVQLTVAEPDARGRRALAIYTRAAASAGGTWVTHAKGSLVGSAPSSVAPGFVELESWPPRAERFDLDPVRTRLEAQGLRFGPAFRGLDALWVEPGPAPRSALGHVRIPEGVELEGAGLGIHPALLDAALHPLMALMPEGPLMLPFAWSDVTLYATGARELRVRVELREAPGGAGSVAAVQMSDGAGRPVLEIGALHLQPVTADQLRAARARRADGLYELAWLAPTDPSREGSASASFVVGPPGSPVARSLGAEPQTWADLAAQAEAGTVAPGRVVLDMTSPAPEGAEYPTILDACTEALEVVQRWLGDGAFEGVELVFVTRHAIEAEHDELVADSARAALWGLVRSVRNEHPARSIRLIDLDLDDEHLGSSLERALELREGPEAASPTELAVRAGALLVPRLVRVTALASLEESALDPRGTVLITGGTGALGQALARHLVRTHGVRNLILTSRRGAGAPGASALETEFGEADGVALRVVACDVAQSDQVDAVLASVDPEHPLCAVFHLAGVLDDGVLAEQTPERMARVLEPKLRGALNLDERVTDPSVPLVFFSSLAGCLGGAGQSNYAAANAGLDGLASRRRGRGLRGLSLAWGLWEPDGEGMTAGLSVADLTRLRRQGIIALTATRAFSLLDRALLLPAFHLVPVELALGALTDPRRVHPMLRALVRSRAPAAVAVAVSGPSHGWPERLDGLPPVEHLEMLVTLVREEVGAVLGMASGSSPSADGTLNELGLDSLMAVELRNRLSDASEVALPPTLAFDYPTPRDIAGLLHESMAPSAAEVTPIVSSRVEQTQLDRIADTLRRVSSEQLEAAGLAPHLLELHDALVDAYDDALDEPANVAGQSTEDLLTFLDGKLGTTG